MEADNASYNSESIGQMSVTSTVASIDTVKVSNRQAQSLLTEDAARGSNSKGKNKNPWKILKQFIGHNTNDRAAGIPKLSMGSGPSGSRKGLVA